ncbi:MAG TPA: CRISPR-associated endonuclease Cas2 [Saprospiraceae bacterium]|nr:CRISPR-associated endonuclease Cas2 [Saprospiraceae bacterium]
MARPRNVEYDLKAKLEKLALAQLVHPIQEEKPIEAIQENPLESLEARIRQILHLVHQKTLKATEMLYLVMYDIEDHRVRNHIAKYLLRKGCIRIQKSVYLARTETKTFEEINTTLAEVQAAYDNHDSILLVPVQASTISSMKILGKEIQIQTLVDPPNTLFF